MNWVVDKIRMEGIKDLQNMLNRVQWSSVRNSMGGWCPICGAHHLEGHKPDCKLKVLLKERENV